MGTVVAEFAAGAASAGANAASPNSFWVLENDGMSMKLDDCTNIIETTMAADSGTMCPVFLDMVRLLMRATHPRSRVLYILLCKRAHISFYGVCTFALKGFHKKCACGKCLVRTGNLFSALGASICHIHGRQLLGLPETGAPPLDELNSLPSFEAIYSSW